MDHYDATMRHIEPVSQFISSSTSMKDAIQLLSTCTGLSFYCPTCRPQQQLPEQPSDNNECYCQFILHHPFTTVEMKEHCSDLRVLNKSDFKAMFHWRTKMQQAITTQKELTKDDSDEDDDDDENEDNNSDTAPTKTIKQKKVTGEGEDADEDDEEMIAKEIEEVRLRRQRERKRLKKKEHEKMQKRRKQAALSGGI